MLGLQCRQRFRDRANGPWKAFRNFASPQKVPIMNRRDFGRSALAAFACGLSEPVSAKPRSQAISASNVLWSADHEEGTLLDWSKTVGFSVSGGNFSDSLVNNENLIVSVTANRPHRGRYSLYTKIKGAINNHTVATRIMRWRDDRGQVFPKEAYYSTWMYVVHNYRTTAGWWIIAQFKTRRPDNSTADPTLTWNLQGDGSGYTFYFYDHSKKVSYKSPVRFRAGEWVHLEAWMRYDTTQGAVTFWLNGQEVINRTGLRTKLTNNDLYQIWGVGNYTSGIEGHPDGPGIAEIYFDDAMVSTARRGTS